LALRTQTASKHFISEIFHARMDGSFFLHHFTNSASHSFSIDIQQRAMPPKKRRARGKAKAKKGAAAKPKKGSESSLSQQKGASGEGERVLAQILGGGGDAETGGGVASEAAEALLAALAPSRSALSVIDELVLYTGEKRAFARAVLESLPSLERRFSGSSGASGEAREHTGSSAEGSREESDEELPSSSVESAVVPSGAFDGVMLRCASLLFQAGDDAGAAQALRFLSHEAETQPSPAVYGWIDAQERIRQVTEASVAQRVLLAENSPMLLDVRVAPPAGKGIFLRGIPAARDAVLLVEHPIISVPKPDSEEEVVACDRCLAVVGVLTNSSAEAVRREKCCTAARRKLRGDFFPGEKTVDPASFVQRTCLRDSGVGVDSAVWCSGDAGKCGVLYCSTECRDAAAASHALTCGDASWEEVLKYAYETTYRLAVAARIVRDCAADLLDRNPRPAGALSLVDRYVDGFCSQPWIEIEQCDPDTHNSESEDNGSQFRGAKQHAESHARDLLLKTAFVTKFATLAGDQSGAATAREQLDKLLSAKGWSQILGAIDLNAAVVETLVPSKPGKRPNRSKCMGVAMFSTHACFNHSCRPNARAVGSSRDTRGVRMKVVAMRRIEPDEQLTISYIDESLPTSARQKHLQVSYGFVCRCEKCLS
jgi:SET domain